MTPQRPVTLVAVGSAGPGRTALLAALPELARVTVIDAGGHDPLVRALLAAGPAAIDAYLLVLSAAAQMLASAAGDPPLAIAAADPITPQLAEQAALLRALGVDQGLSVVITADPADPAGVLRKTAELIPGTQAHAVCLRTGDGLDELRRALADLLATLPARLDPPAARLAGDGPPLETRVIDAALDFGPRREREPQHGVRVTIHLRGSHAPARLARLGGRFWQVRLDRPLVALVGDRLVIRQDAFDSGYGGVVLDSGSTLGGGDAFDSGYTLGGGIVLDPGARRHPTSNEVIVRLTRIWRGQPPLEPEPPRSR